MTAICVPLAACVAYYLEEQRRKVTYLIDADDDDETETTIDSEEYGRSTMITMDEREDKRTALEVTRDELVDCIYMATAGSDSELIVKLCVLYAEVRASIELKGYL